MKFLVVGLNPTIQNTYSFDNVRLGQVNRARTHRLDVAGKGGNISRVLHQLGEDVVHLTFCGGRNAAIYRELSARDNVLMAAPVGGEVRYCHTLLGGENGATEIVEDGAPVTAGLEDAVLAEYAEQLEISHTVVIGGSRAPGFSPGIYASMLRGALASGVRTVFDVRGADLLSCRPDWPTVLKINVSEFVSTFLPDLDVPEDTPPNRLPDELRPAMVRAHEETGVRNSPHQRAPPGDVRGGRGGQGDSGAEPRRREPYWQRRRVHRRRGRRAQAGIRSSWSNCPGD
jgi:fructose-1-phosphate kinase PfkB-like protein